MTEQEYIVEVTARHFDLLNESDYSKEQCRMLLNEMKEQLFLYGISSSSKPEPPKPPPPKPPLCMVLRTGVGHLCKNCNSTMPRSGFLMLFGKRYCDNKECPNSKPEKNYYYHRYIIHN